MTSDPALFSLIVGTFGRADPLNILIASLAAQTDKHFELILVDQNADDRILPIVEAARGKGLVVKHVRQSEPNLSLARNTGLKHAAGGIVAFPDDDCWYEPGVIADVRATFALKPRVDAVVGRWVEAEPEGQRAAERLTYETWRRFRAGHAPSMALFLRPERIAASGGFDARLGTGRYFGSSEDTDLLITMLAAGDIIRYTPDAHIHHWHDPAPPLTKQNLRRARSYGRGIGAVYVKQRLDAWVRVRGVLAPFANALRTGKPLTSLPLAAATSLGRLEGAINWSRQYRSSGSSAPT